MSSSSDGGTCPGQLKLACLRLSTKRAAARGYDTIGDTNAAHCVPFRGRHAAQSRCSGSAGLKKDTMVRPCGITIHIPNLCLADVSAGFEKEKKKKANRDKDTTTAHFGSRTTIAGPRPRPGFAIHFNYHGIFGILTPCQLKVVRTLPLDQIIYSLWPLNANANQCFG